METIISDLLFRMDRTTHNLKITSCILSILLFILYCLMFFVLWRLFFYAAAAQAETPTVQIFTKPPPPSYSYVPSALKDSQKTRLYFCASSPTYQQDHIFYAESGGVSGPFSAKGSSIPNTFTVSLSPAGSGKFDASHTCDPSVVRDPVSGTRYLYYGGSVAVPVSRTAIGVSSSANGVTDFRRLNQGNPIIAVSPEVTARQPSLNGYGTGQPSVFIRDGFYYIAYTDTFGKASNGGNGAGIYVMRSTDPTFQVGVYALGASGWIHLEDLYGHTEPYERYLLRTSHILLEGFSADWAYSPAGNKIILAQHQAQSQAEIYTFDADSFVQLSHTSVPYTKTWVDGPALLRDPQGQIICPIILYGAFGIEVWSAQLNMQEGNICP